MNWILITVKQSPPPLDWSPVIDCFRDFGIENTMETEDSLTGCFVDVDGVQTQIEGLKEAVLSLGVHEFIAEPLVEVDWENEWKKFFKPRRVGENFVVRPTWEEFDASANDRVIVLDPGQAFGTGDHPTTRMCLEYLEQQVKTGDSVLDLGCGSGILAIGAKLLGSRDTLAIDIDPIAVEVAKENIQRNSIEVRTGVGDVLDLELENGWDLVVSNIISATLINLAPDAAYALKPGGKWIVSGIIVQNWKDVLNAATKTGFSYLEHREEDGWIAGVFQSSSSPVSL